MTAPTIALFMHDRLNDYQARLQTDYEQAARRHDLRAAVHSAEKSAEVQVRQIRSALALPKVSRPRALIISPVSEIALLPLIHDAAQLGVAWVFLTRWNDAIHGLRRQYPKVPIFAVTPNHVEIGRIQGLQARALMTIKDEIVYIQGPMATYSSRQRREGFDKEMAGIPGLRLSAFNADWSQVGGEGAMKSWLSTFPIRKLPSFMIVAQNDAMAIGARTAVFDSGSVDAASLGNDLRVIGCDGSPGFGQRMVMAGQLRATVNIPPVSGRAVDELVTSLRLGRQPPAEITVAVESFPDVDALTRESRRRT